MLVRSKDIVLVDINKLVFNPKNNNKHPKEQIERLAKLIEFQGFRNPVVVSNRTGFVVAGHGRIEAARKLKMSQVPVMYQEFNDEAQEYAYLTSDNAIASWAELDLSMVNSEMLDLGPDFDLDLLGIKDFVIEPAEKFEALTDEDDVPEVAHPITRRGDIWILGNHRLMCGDSTIIDDVENLISGKKAEMIFTDPPYGVDYKGINNDSRGGLEDLLSQAFANYAVVTIPGSPVYVFHSDRCADIFHEVFRQYFHFSSMIIWIKPALVLSQTDYQSKHEPIMYGWVEGGSHKFYGDRKQTSIWEFGKEHLKGHTTPKPVALIEHALELSSKAGQNVIDLFGGSGSTLMACEKKKRKAFLMELDPKYCDVIVKRWEQYTDKKAILESTGQTYEELKAERDGTT